MPLQVETAEDLLTSQMRQLKPEVVSSCGSELVVLGRCSQNKQSSEGLPLPSLDFPGYGCYLLLFKLSFTVCFSRVKHSLMYYHRHAHRFYSTEGLASSSKDQVIRDSFARCAAHHNFARPSRNPELGFPLALVNQACAGLIFLIISH